MERNPHSLWREDRLILVLIVVCVLGAFILGCGEVETGKAEQETSDLKAWVQPDTRLDINCAATVSSGTHLYDMPAPYCYSKASRQK